MKLYFCLKMIKFYIYNKLYNFVLFIFLFVEAKFKIKMQLTFFKLKIFKMIKKTKYISY